jgi:trk system potassium uptake protein TrkH
MRPHIILRYAGVVLLFNALFLLLSAGISALHRDSALLPLAYSAIVALLFGLFPLIFVPATQDISNDEGLVIVVASWLLSCLVGLLPYVMWGGEFTFTNAWFESVSGFTTTGSSILTDVEALPPGLLFWRAATHWIGGIGIIVFVLSVLPGIGRAAMVLYKSEISPLAADNFQYRTKKTLQILLVVYVGLTVAETLALLVCGMTVFDAVTHAFATIATGGFSTKNLSIAYFHSVPIEIVIMVFMLLSGVHFGLLFAAASGPIRRIWTPSVVRYYLAAMAVGIVLVAWKVHHSIFPNWLQSLRYASFQVISLGTTTGFASADSGPWPAFAQLILIFFTLQGACAGSTSGAIKVDRVIVFWKSILNQIKKLKHPRSVLALKIDNTVVASAVVEGSVLYISLYLAVVFASTLLLTAIGVDSLTAFSGSAATMGGVGPGFGMVSSLANYSGIPTAGKWIFSMTMLLGRLEIFGLIVFFMLKTRG